MDTRTSRFDRYLDMNLPSSTSDKKFLQKRTVCGCQLNVLLFIFLLIFIIFGLISALLYLQIKNISDIKSSKQVSNVTHQSVNKSPPTINDKTATKLVKRQTEPIISANTLLTYLITKRKICLFEVSTLQIEESR